MVFETDVHILTNPDQSDYWSNTHVLIPFFMMLWGFEWYVTLLVLYFWKAFEALPGIDYAQTQDALIVDPVQALMGILTFLTMQEFGYMRVAFPFPQNYSHFFPWLITGISWIPTLTVVIVLDVTDNFEYDWIYIFTFLCISLHAGYYQTNWKQTIAVIAYPLILSALISMLNRVPFSGWYTSLYAHIVLVPFLFMYWYRKLRTWFTNDNLPTPIEEQAKLVLPTRFKTMPLN